MSTAWIQSRVEAAEWKDWEGEEVVEEEGEAKKGLKSVSMEGVGERSRSEVGRRMGCLADSVSVGVGRAGLAGKREYRGEAGGEDDAMVAFDVQQSLPVSPEVSEAVDIDAVVPNELELDAIDAAEDAVLDRLLAPEFVLFRLRRLESSAARSRFWSRMRGRMFGGLGVCMMVL